MQFNYADDTQLYLSMKPVRIGSSSLDIFFYQNKLLVFYWSSFWQIVTYFQQWFKKKKTASIHHFLVSVCE